MTKISEIRTLIAEQAVGPGERRTLEAVADAVEHAMGADVPARPEFKVQLRRQLIKEARRTLTPWYRRPAVWGTSMGMVAATLVMAIGLQLFDGTEPTPAPAVPELDARNFTTSPAPELAPMLTSDPTIHVPEVILPDVAITAQSAEPDSPAPDVSQGLSVITLTGRPDLALFGDLAARLGFTGQVEQVKGAFRVAQGSRSLQMTADGALTFIDTTGESSGAFPTGGAEGAATIARQFLDRALLPVPELAPAVTAGAVGAAAHLYTVTYTPKVSDRPVVNGKTVIRVNDFSRVLQVEAFVPTGQEAHRPYRAIAATDAVAVAAQKGGSFTGADLVWVRTAVGERAYLQPYWRVFGTTGLGGRVARFVPALSRER